MQNHTIIVTQESCRGWPREIVVEGLKTVSICSNPEMKLLLIPIRKEGRLGAGWWLPGQDSNLRPAG